MPSSGTSAEIWTWVSSICAPWAGQDAARYVGPFTATTKAPVLVIGNQFDPATRYEGAVKVSKLLPNSRLLTVHGWGHTSLFLSTCADAVVAAYLVNLTLPHAARSASRTRRSSARAREPLRRPGRAALAWRRSSTP